MMNIDRIALFAALAQHDIRVARSAYVDSAEGAVAFAQRRTAADGRLVPIRLCAVFPGIPVDDAPAFVETPFADAESIADAYRRLAPKAAAAGGQVMAQTVVEPGTDLAIAARVDPALGKATAALTTPHRIASEHERRMLDHLLERVTRFFEQSALETLQLAPVRLHGHSYTVLDGVATGVRPLAVRHTDEFARDRKGHFHASGRQ